MATKHDAAFIARVNKPIIDPEDMETVLHAASELEPHRRCFEALVGITVNLLSHRSIDYRVSLMFRLEALNEVLRKLDDMPGLAKAGDEEGQILIPEWSIAAACKCKMITGKKNRISFDVEEFRTSAMVAATAEGTA